jgi:Na+-driven multidrug efflux pump
VISWFQNLLFKFNLYRYSSGFRLACATLVGQWLGAGRPKRARAAAAVSVAMCMAAMIPFAVGLHTLNSVGPIVEMMKAPGFNP